MLLSSFQIEQDYRAHFRCERTLKKSGVMILSLSQSDLLDYIRAQLHHFFPDQYDFHGKDVDISFHLALERMENCIKAIALPGYHNDAGNPFFYHLHADQYSQFIYFLGNSLWMQSQNKPLCDKLLQLNRVLFSVFISYKCLMPEHFVLGHPVGTILGNAAYHDYLVVLQGVTVNTNQDESGNPAPILGKGLYLGANSKIIGNKSVGDRVSLGVGTLVYQQDIPDDSVVTRDKSGSCTIHRRKKKYCMAQSFFNVPI